MKTRKQKRAELKRLKIKNELTLLTAIVSLISSIISLIVALISALNK
ncbi:hypothetical protein [Apilactobacillus xinyiensis]|nr:hypothetical protein [Apilactobacillus xinyiensis]MCL0330551.1 hypothetical protein [Apilactobacillus xinyiensis]